MTRPVIFALASAILLGAPPAGAARGASHQDFMSKHYPPKALANGEQGQVAFSIDVDGGGRIERCAITQSSGYPTLDRETCDFLVRYGGFEPARDTKGLKMRSTKTGLINWTLPAGVKPSTAPRLAATQLPPPVICKRTERTGSTLAHITYCMTEEDWVRHDNVTRDMVEQMQGRIFCGDHGCS
jgi:TonB family protein